jgi:hypothetical protein
MTWASDGFYRSGTKSETCAPRCAVTAAIEPQPVRRLEVLTASTEGDLEAAFTTMISVPVRFRPLPDTQSAGSFFEQAQAPVDRLNRSTPTPLVSTIAELVRM